MTFIANLDGKRVVSLDFSVEDWYVLKNNYRDRTLICNDENCRSSMIPKTYGSTGTQYFAHKSLIKGESACKYCSGESPEHLYLKAYIYETLKRLGFQPELEMSISEINRQADVLVGDIVFEVQLSQQSTHSYEQRSQDYWDMGKEVYWIIYDKHAKFSNHDITYPVVFLTEKPVSSTEYVPSSAIYESLKTNPAIVVLDKWIESIVNGDPKWTTNNRVYRNRNYLRGEIRKLFIQWWGFIVKATEKYRLKLSPEKALRSQLQERYGADIESLTANNLREIFNTLKRGRIDDILKWLYPHLNKCPVKWEYGDFLGMSKKLWRVVKYAKELCNDQEVKNEPSCSCNSEHHTVGAWKRKDGVCVAYLFCEKCGQRSTQCVAKSKFTSSTCQWVKAEVNYEKTDYRPW